MEEQTALSRSRLLKSWLSLVSGLSRNKFIASSGVYVLGSLLQKGLAFLLIPLYTRYLTPDDYGIVGLGTSIASVLTIVLGFGVYASVGRHYFDYKDNPARLKQYITTNYLFLMIASGVLALATDFAGSLIWEKVTSGQIPFSPYIRIVIWSSYVELLVQIPLVLYRAQQRARTFIVAQLSVFSLTLALTIWLVVFRRMGAAGQLSALLLSNGIMSVILTFFLFKEWFIPRLNLGDMRESLAYGIPLIPHGLSGWALGFIDRLLLESRIPLAALGLYNLGYQLGMIMAILVTSINMAWVPYYYMLQTDRAQPETTIRRVVELYIALVGGICLLGILFSQEILHWMVASGYRGAAQYVPLIMLAYLFNGYYYFVSAPLFYYKKTKLIPLITISSAILNIVLNLWWIPSAGALGSAWATLVAFVFAVGLAYFLSRPLQKIDYPIVRFMAINLLLLLAACFATYPPVMPVLWQFLLKLALLALFAGMSYVWFIRNNLSWLRRENHPLAPEL